MQQLKNQQFRIVKDDLTKTSITTTTELGELAERAIRFKITRFSITANNISYAVFGRAMQYWDFFPASDSEGLLPVWGYGDIAESNHDGFKVGERVYGYLPSAEYVDLCPSKVADGYFIDASEHRQKLAGAYQYYLRVKQPQDENDQRMEELQCIFRPLFVTSWLAADFLQDNAFFGGKQALLASASSKTALGIAHQLRQMNIRTIGLTSESNAEFCRATGLYDDIIKYTDVDQLPRDETVYVDMSGNGKVLAAVHAHFESQLKYCCMIGGTHWQKREIQNNLAGAKPTFFFAPTQLAVRAKQWGMPELETRIQSSLLQFYKSIESWLIVESDDGFKALERGYLALLEGAISPSKAQVITLSDAHS